MKKTVLTMTLAVLGCMGVQAQEKLFQLLVSMKQKSPELEIPEGIFYDGIPKTNLYVQKKDTKTGKFIRKERTEASYERSFEVGEDVKPEEIAAKYENGVLTLTVPNKAAIAEKAPAKQIEIK